MTNEEYKLDMVSVRLVPDAPLLSERRICSPEDAVHVMGSFLSGMDREVLAVINLRADGKPINGHIASIGALNQTLAHPRELLKAAILSNAASMLILHCHPSGCLEPSEADAELTDRMIELCGLVGIPLLDHIIVGGGGRGYFSFRERAIIEEQDARLQTNYRRLDSASENERKAAERGMRRRKSL